MLCALWERCADWSQDVRYLSPLVEQVAKEEDERTAWDTMTIERKRK